MIALGIVEPVGRLLRSAGSILFYKMEPSKYLKEKYQEHGEMRLWYCKKENGAFITKWPKWKLYSQCSKVERAQANLMEIWSTLVILDVEEKKNIKYAFAFVDRNNFSYELYNSRKGYHFHLEFPELKNLNNEVRLRIKEKFISIAKTDPSKKNGLISIPNKGHFKNGRLKLLIRSIERGKNIVPKDILKQAKDVKIPQLKHCVRLCVVSKEKVNDCKVLAYCLKHQLTPGTGRGIVLAANFAVLLKHTKERNEAQRLMELFYNAQGMPNAFWLNHIYNKNTDINKDFRCGQIRNWLRANQDPLIECRTCGRCEHGKR